MSMDCTHTAFTIESNAGTRYTVYRRPRSVNPGGHGAEPAAIGSPSKATLTTYGGRAVKAYPDETYRVDGSGETFRLTADSGEAD
jgi:hypothetical protein